MYGCWKGVVPNFDSLTFVAVVPELYPPSDDKVMHTTTGDKGV